MAFPLWFSLGFGVCLILFWSLLAVAHRKYYARTSPEKLPSFVRDAPHEGEYTPNFAPETCTPYSIFSRMISGLGNLLYASARYFNVAMKLMGLAGVLFGVMVFFELPFGWTAALGLVGFEAGSVGLFLLSIYTENRHYKHGIVAAISFGGYLVAVVFWAFPILQLSFVPPWFVIFHALPVIMVVYHQITMRHFNLHLQMQDTRVISLKENYNFSEWLLFFTLSGWFISLFFALL